MGDDWLAEENVEKSNTTPWSCHLSALIIILGFFLFMGTPASLFDCCMLREAAGDFTALFQHSLCLLESGLESYTAEPVVAVVAWDYACK